VSHEVPDFAGYDGFLHPLPLQDAGPELNPPSVHDQDIQALKAPHKQEKATHDDPHTISYAT
jgi:hypothetical protein